MFFRTLLIVAATCAASGTVLAHPGEHGAFDEKLIPTNCAQLADEKRYTNDVSYPEIKALKARCDAKEKVETPSPQPKVDRSKPE